MLQASFGGNVLPGLRQFPIAQRAQQVSRQHHTLAAPLGQPLFGQEIEALLERVFDLAAKPQIAQPWPTSNQLLVKSCIATFI